MSVKIKFHKTKSQEKIIGDNYLYCAFLEYLKLNNIEDNIDIEFYFVKWHGIDILQARLEMKNKEVFWYSIFKNYKEAYEFYFRDTLKKYGEILYRSYMNNIEIPKDVYDKIFGKSMERILSLNKREVNFNGNNYCIIFLGKILKKKPHL